MRHFIPIARGSNARFVHRVMSPTAVSFTTFSPPAAKSTIHPAPSRHCVAQNVPALDLFLPRSIPASSAGFERDGELIRLSLRRRRSDASTLFLTRFDYETSAQGDQEECENERKASAAESRQEFNLGSAEPTIRMAGNNHDGRKKQRLIRVLRSGYGTATLRLGPEHVASILSVLAPPPPAADSHQPYGSIAYHYHNPSRASQALVDRSTGQFNMTVSSLAAAAAASPVKANLMSGICFSGTVWMQGFVACEEWIDVSTASKACNRLVEYADHAIGMGSNVRRPPLIISDVVALTMLRVFLDAALKEMMLVEYLQQ